MHKQDACTYSVLLLRRLPTATVSRDKDSLQSIFLFRSIPIASLCLCSGLVLSGVRPTVLDGAVRALRAQPPNACLAEFHISCHAARTFETGNSPVHHLVFVLLRV